MYTAAELQMLRNADPTAVLPGIDTQVGNLATGPLTQLSALSQNSQASIYYNPTQNNVYIRQAGAVLQNYNFGSADVIIEANNVTLQDCTFTNPSGGQSVLQTANASGAVVENCSFTGPTDTSSNGEFIGTGTYITVEDNSFVNAPSDGVDIAGGVVTGNYFSGGGYQTGSHADAITVGSTTGGPATITDNFIDWTANPQNANNGIRITAIGGSTNNVTVSGNYIIGACYSIDPGTVASTTSSGTLNTFSNISITNNYLGFSLFGPFYPGPHPGVTDWSGNVVFDFTNPAASTQAWDAYKAGITNPIVSTGQALTNTGAVGSTTTLYGAGLKVSMWGGRNGGETNFVGGAGLQSMTGGVGANIFTYLAVSDSPQAGVASAFLSDRIGNFDPAKDVIDLSRIDGNITTAGLQNFTFIGTAAFDGTKGEVRYWQDPTGCTWVAAALAGDTTPDLTIRLGGLLTLNAANFAVTAAQSSADMTAGKALTETMTRGSANGLAYLYSNVQGKNYSSFEEFNPTSGADAADLLNLNSGASQLNIYATGATVTRGSGVETLQSGANTYQASYKAVESIQANGVGNETFSLGQNYGQETIAGFIQSGPNADTLNLSTAAFSYLSAGMTQAQDLAAVLSSATSTSSGVTFADSHGDALTLTGLTKAVIAASPAHFHFA